MNPENKKRHALHEAGHSTIAIMLNVLFTTTDIYDREVDIHGTTKIIVREDMTIDQKRNAVYAMLAGGFATGEDASNEKGVAKDYQEARNIIANIIMKGITSDTATMLNIEDYLKECEGETKKLVVKYNKFIEAVADELLIKRELSRDQVEEFINKMPKD